jgi:hypothetical protein
VGVRPDGPGPHRQHSPDNPAVILLLFSYLRSRTHPIIDGSPLSLPGCLFCKSGSFDRALGVHPLGLALKPVGQPDFRHTRVGLLT